MRDAECRCANSRPAMRQARLPPEPKRERRSSTPGIADSAAQSSSTVSMVRALAALFELVPEVTDRRRVDDANAVVRGLPPIGIVEEASSIAEKRRHDVD